MHEIAGILPRSVVMKRKTLLVALGFAACLSSCWWMNSITSAGWMIERKATETRDFVESTVPLGRAEVSSRIRDGVLGEKHLEGSTVHLPGKPINFPYREHRSFGVADWSAHENTWPPITSFYTEDPAMDRFLRLPPEAKKDDILLQGGGGEQWYSEYVASGKSLPFHCDFIIHLQEDGPTQTRIEVLEYNPRVKFGKAFHMTHVGPVFATEDHLVAPTTKDRVEMLERIQAIAR